MKNYPVDYLPKWVREELDSSPKGERVQLTGTIFARYQDNWSVGIWSSTGFPVSLGDLK